MILEVVIGGVVVNLLYMLLVRWFEYRVGGIQAKDDLFDINKTIATLGIVLGVRPIPKAAHDVALLLLGMRTLLFLSSSLFVTLILLVVAEG